jgi:hypothetical protein
MLQQVQNETRQLICVHIIFSTGIMCLASMFLDHYVSHRLNYYISLSLNFDFNSKHTINHSK